MALAVMPKEKWLSSRGSPEGLRPGLMLSLLPPLCGEDAVHQENAEHGSWPSCSCSQVGFFDGHFPVRSETMWGICPQILEASNPCPSADT